jgi:hypothetical protein
MPLLGRPRPLDEGQNSIDHQNRWVQGTLSAGTGSKMSGNDYADVLALFAFVGSPNSAPHLPQWALVDSAVLMEIPIAMIVACRLLPVRANRLANISAGGIMTLVNGFLTFVLL